MTTERSDEARRTELGKVADVAVVGRDDVDVIGALELLRGLGASVVLCEGGPSLNGQLVNQDAIDELCLTIAPLAAGGASSRLAHGAVPPAPRSLQLDRVLEEDSVLFFRYVRSRDLSAASEPSPS
jgi:riboflavin biosynthesis pyrimidine reductase